MGRKPKYPKLVDENAPIVPVNANPSLGMESPVKVLQANSACLDTSKKDSAGLSKWKKSSKNRNSIIRRSERLHNLIPHAQNQEIATVIEEINLSESEKEDEPNGEQTNAEQTSSEPLPHERNLEEKIDYLVDVMEYFKSKAEKMNFQSELRHADLNYRSLYFESQKKIDALTEENNQLRKNVEISVAKLEAFEKGSRNTSKIIENLKDVILVSNLGKATEAACHPPSQETSGGGNSSLDAAAEPQVPAAKRKKLAGKSKKNSIDLAL